MVKIWMLSQSRNSKIEVGKSVTSCKKYLPIFQSGGAVSDIVAIESEIEKNSRNIFTRGFGTLIPNTWSDSADQTLA